MLIKEVTQNVFKNLLSQSPEVEILEAKFQAWRQVCILINNFLKDFIINLDLYLIPLWCEIFEKK